MIMLETPCFSATCPENNVEYTGDLVTNMFGIQITKKKDNVPSWTECSTWCNTHHGCKAWSYSTSQRSCTAKTNNNQKRTAEGFVSGSRDCQEGSKCTIIKVYFWITTQKNQ